MSTRMLTHPDHTPRGLRWVKATRSMNQGACVEVAALASGEVAMRDTKDAGAGPMLVFTKQEWRSFLDGAKNGEFDQLV